MSNNIVYKSAAEILQCIHSGQWTSEEVLLAFLGQIEKFNPQINAVTDLRNRDELIKEAREKDALLKSGQLIGPLHGLPITVKDGFNVKGLISSNGSPALKKNIAKEDAVLIKKLKNAGAIIIGKTNLPLFSIDWQSTNNWFGQTNNPYNPEYVVGGSSGGSAAALAMGFTPLELGSDAGGSIRVPAHFCGICGIRPTEQALSNRGNFLMPGKPQGHRYVTVSGPMARTVDDLILAMSVLTQQSEISEIAPVDFNRSSWAGGQLRVAYVPTMYNLPIDEEYSQIIHRFLDKLRADRHQLTEDKPDYQADLAYRINGRLFGMEVAASAPAPAFLARIFMFFFILLKYKDYTWAKTAAYGITMSPNKYYKTLVEKEQIGDAFIKFFDNYDIWITPVASIPAFKHQRAGIPFSVNSKKVSYTDAMGRFSFDTAVAGHPVVVIPIGMTKTGLPVGISIHGRKWEDKRLLEIASHLQKKYTNGFVIPGHDA